ncbi:hypothetical protein [Pseudooceanicola nitratireducens]|uniref:hypothetical protein n=1 Tax=Pseudooceanicola nitratireducens TaxID=517719 RepID=UPI003C7DDDC0
MTNWFKTLFAPVQVPPKSDPFAHPEVAAMSPRELADLPLVPPPAPGSASRSRVALRRGQVQACP